MSLADSIGAIIKRLFPSLFLRGTFEFRVVQVFGAGAAARYVLAPARATWLDSIGTPSAPIGLCDLWPGAAGHAATVQAGSSVCVQFLDCDQARPIAVGFSPLSSPNGIPIESIHDATAFKIGPAASLGIARLTDPVNIGTFQIIGGIGLSFGGISWTPPGGGAPVPFPIAPLIVGMPLSGKISGASTKGKSE